MTGDPTQPPEAAAVDLTPERIRAAIGFQLKAAGALVGNDKVVGFFRDQAGSIFDKRVVLPPITKAAIKEHVQQDFADDINSLISQ